VRIEDLVYFKNMLSIDLSDNQIQLEWLRNLENLEEIDLQYNRLEGVDLQMGMFLNLKYLHLSYNKIPPAHIL
jgi:Leucine-rich repeat (LRR) protein